MFIAIGRNRTKQSTTSHLMYSCVHMCECRCLLAYVDIHLILGPQKNICLIQHFPVQTCRTHKEEVRTKNTRNVQSLHHMEHDIHFLPPTGGKDTYGQYDCTHTLQ